MEVMNAPAPVFSFLFGDTCAEDVHVNNTSMAYNGKNVRCEDQEILQTLIGKPIKEREIKC